MPGIGLITGLQAVLEVQSHGLADVGQGLLARIPLTHTSGQGWTMHDVRAVGLLFQNYRAAHVADVHTDHINGVPEQPG